jgi:hypothetical protein
MLACDPPHAHSNSDECLSNNYKIIKMINPWAESSGIKLKSLFSQGVVVVNVSR